MKIAICDDDKKTVNTVSQWVLEFFEQRELNLCRLVSYYDGDALLSDYQNGARFDMLFLDIEMPTTPGLTAAHAIRQMDVEVLIIFITNYPNFMQASFKVEAFDFLTKPLTPTAFYFTLERAVDKWARLHATIDIQAVNGTAVLPLKDIVYIISDKHYVTFFRNDAEPLKSKMTLDQVEKKLANSRQFVRCHQSYLVNLDYVRELQRTQLVLAPHVCAASAIPISRNYKELIKEQFLRYHLKTKGADHEPTR